MSARLQVSRRVPIRTIDIVVDLEDVFYPEMPLEEFIKENKMEPKPPRYRMVSIEVVNCSEDQQPVLISECGRCPRFLRRYEGKIFCRKYVS